MYVYIYIYIYIHREVLLRAWLFKRGQLHALGVPDGRSFESP